MSCLVRTSPVAVCGTIDKYYLDRENNCFVLTYTQDREYSAPTEIYVHKEYKSIECDAGYTVESIGKNGAAMIKITAAPGNHSIKINF